MVLRRIEILRDRTASARCDDGFFTLRRLVLLNHYPDGSVGRPYDCDVLTRRGVDAVAVLLFGAGPAGPEATPVVLRRAIRPAVYFRADQALPVPDPRPYPSLLELPAGIVEPGDRGEEGIRRRAAKEALEEAGLRVDPEAVQLLGQGTFTAPGVTAERLHYAAAEVDIAAGQPPTGDGSAFEERTEIVVLPLGRALTMCRSGEIEDAKTEIGLRRLAEHLAGEH